MEVDRESSVPLYGRHLLKWRTRSRNVQKSVQLFMEFHKHCSWRMSSDWLVAICSVERDHAICDCVCITAPCDVEAAQLYFVSSRERPWHHWARPRIHAARRIHCVNLGAPFWTCEKTHKLLERWQASYSGIRADVTVVLEVTQSIAIVLFNPCLKIVFTLMWCSKNLSVLKYFWIKSLDSMCNLTKSAQLWCFKIVW